ncbi:MAG: DNA alkylation repair protein [Bacteroidetes bacterium]|nr:DNA alkylation repair protein [Bacteroidota bacterium]
MLDDKTKKKILSFIEGKDYDKLISYLDSLKTKHAGTPKTDIKVFTIKSLVKGLSTENKKKNEKSFFELGKKYCSMNEPVAQEIGIHIIWRGYAHNKKETKDILLKIADSDNWEVREYAAGAFYNVLNENPELYSTMLKWAKHKSENVRRAVVFSALAYSKKGEAPDTEKAFTILEPLMSDASVYVKKNLGPFILGSHLGNSFPEEVFAQLKKWLKSDNEHVRWNIAMTFNNSFGNRYPAKALEILKKLLPEESKVVSRAVISTLRHLNKRHSNLVQPFIKKEGIEI